MEYWVRSALFRDSRLFALTQGARLARGRPYLGSLHASGRRGSAPAGDQCQLPPTVSSEAAREAGAELSLFERLAHAGVKPHLLDRQCPPHWDSRLPLAHIVTASVV